MPRFSSLFAGIKDHHHYLYLVPRPLSWYNHNHKGGIDMLDQNDLQAIAELLKPINERLDKLEQGQNELRADVATLKEDVEIIKEDVQVTRNATNTLLDWAEQAQLEVKIPLYKKAE